MTRATSPEIRLPAIRNWTHEIMQESQLNDQIITAFEKGIEHGRKEEKTKAKLVAKESFLTNLTICCKVSEKFVTFLEELNIKCDLATIKPVSLKSFKAIFVIGLEDYADHDKRKIIYKESQDLRTGLELTDLNFEIIVMNNSGEFSENTIFENGFSLKFRQNDDSEKN